jgi:hypothetical protein
VDSEDWHLTGSAIEGMEPDAVSYIKENKVDWACSMGVMNVCVYKTI